MPSPDKVLAAVDSNLQPALDRLFALLRIPSISTDPAYAKHCAEAAEWHAKDLKSLGFKAEVRKTAGHPVVLGHRPKKGAPHVLFYGHYDVQPVDPLNLWHNPPFEPKVVEIEKGRKAIVARGACDDKGQVMTFIEACRAWITATGDLPIGVTVLLEGEEECGSPSLPAFVKANAKELKADFGLVCDTGMWDAKTPAVTSTLRGMVYEEFVVRAANRDLHSGVYGGAALNPNHVVAEICGSFHGKNGRIRIPGFYKGVKAPSEKQLQQWKSLKLTEKAFLGPVGLKSTIGEDDRMLIEHIQSRPTCDVNGIWGGYAGAGSKTVIPAEAGAKVSFRLVAGQDPDAIRKAFRAYVKDRVPKQASVEFRSYVGSSAVAFDTTSAPFDAARAALREEWGKAAVTIGLGGSIPIMHEFRHVLGLDCVLVGFALEDDRVHSPNEKYDLAAFHKGMRSWARIIGKLGG
ncbi:MAG TPA: M20/M25/M40 family metallo-hydrolase [Beijerinckiaceae bacterium]|mgnify:CR=1 FL=1|nr:M20/M25/M40 family metallo-hydrolase [Beijerinckiaceae bacterium]